MDECYTATDRANKYTLIHLVLKVRHTAIAKAMRAVSEKSGIALTEVFGYDRIVSDSAEEPDAIAANALYRWLIANLKRRDPTFEYWISPEKKSKGLLSNFVESPVEAGMVDFMGWSKRKLARTMCAERNAQARLRDEQAFVRAELMELRETNERLKMMLQAQRVGIPDVVVAHALPLPQGE